MSRAPFALAPGMVLGQRYRIEEPLAAGGFGRVYRATQLPLGRSVAVKVLVAPEPGAAARFAQQAALAQRLEHPNTVRILDFGSLEDQSPFIVWELLRGETLGDLLARQGPLPLGVALGATAQILKSLMEAHGVGIVHRDIKPANVFVTPHPGEPTFVKVLDFGIAKDLLSPAPLEGVRRGGTIAMRALAPATTPSSSRALTSASQVLGTPRYMAPERAMGDLPGPDTDVYAVGLLLAEMLSGRPVFEGFDAARIATAQASDDPVPIPSSPARPGSTRGRSRKRQRNPPPGRKSAAPIRPRCPPRPWRIPSGCRRRTWTGARAAFRASPRSRSRPCWKRTATTSSASTPCRPRRTRSSPRR